MCSESGWSSSWKSCLTSMNREPRPSSGSPVGYRKSEKISLVASSRVALGCQWVLRMIQPRFNSRSETSLESTAVDHSVDSKSVHNADKIVTKKSESSISLPFSFTHFSS